MPLGLLHQWVRIGLFLPEQPCRASQCPLTPAHPDPQGLYDVGATCPPPSTSVLSQNHHPFNKPPPPISAPVSLHPLHPASHHAGGDETAGEVPQEADHGADPGRGLRWRGGGQGQWGDRGVPTEGQLVSGRSFLQGDVTGERPGPGGVQVRHNRTVTQEREVLNPT